MCNTSPRTVAVIVWGTGCHIGVEQVLGELVVLARGSAVANPLCDRHHVLVCGTTTRATISVCARVRYIGVHAIAR